MTDTAALSKELQARRNELSKLQIALEACQPAQNGDDCAICLDILAIPGAVVAKCGHVFHIQCITEHLTRIRKSCPICRKRIRRQDLITVVNGICNQESTEEDGGYAEEVKGVIEMIKQELQRGDVDRVLKRVREREKEVVAQVKRVETRERMVRRAEERLERSKTLAQQQVEALLVDVELRKTKVAEKESRMKRWKAAEKEALKNRLERVEKREKKMEERKGRLVKLMETQARKRKLELEEENERLVKGIADLRGERSLSSAFSERVSLPKRRRVAVDSSHGI